MAKARALDTATLNQAIRDYAGIFLLPSQWSKRNPKVAVNGRDWVVQSMYNFHFKDEFDYVLNGMSKWLGEDAYKEFKAATKDVFTPRSKDVFEQLLAEKLAVRPDGSKIAGAVGTVNIGDIIVGHRPKLLKLASGREVTLLKPVKKPVYAGQENLFGTGALNMNISAELGIAGLDAIVDWLDSDGAGVAVLHGRTGAQPADPDAATTGTLLFENAMAATAFGAAADQADGTIDAAAAAIGDDTSADATGTLGYMRCSSTSGGTVATIVDDHIDGEAGTSGADFNFNTVSIVSGATVSITAWTITLDQGTTAT